MGKDKVEVVDRELIGIQEAVEKNTGMYIPDEEANQLRDELNEIQRKADIIRERK